MIHRLFRQPRRSSRRGRRAISTTLVTFLLTRLLVAGPAEAQGPVPIICDGSAYIVQEDDPGKLFKFVESLPDAFAIQATGIQLIQGEVCNPGEACNLMIGAQEVEANNMGFRSTAVGGFLYAVWLTAGNMGLIRIDDVDNTVTVTSLGTPMDVGNGSFPTNRTDAGDVSPDGNRMYINTVGSGTLTIVDLIAFEVVATPTIVGDGGIVNDWAYNPRDGNLYGGDRDGGQVARLNLAAFELGGDVGDITRVDFDVDTCAGPPPAPPFPAGSVCISPTGLPTAASPFGAFGGAWFNSSGELFLYRNTCEEDPGDNDVCPEFTPADPNAPPNDPDPDNGAGKIYQIDLTSFPDPLIVRTLIGRNSQGFNDSTACIRIPEIGAAKGMTAPCGLPSTVTIEYRFENFADAMDPLTVVSDLSAIDDLTEVFGTHGVDWTFTSISLTSGPAGFANAGFDGHTDTELISQGPPTQSLDAGDFVEITVEIEVLTLANANSPPADGFPPGTFCNQVVLTGINELDIAIGDPSTQLPDQLPFDPNSSLISCVTLADPAIGLMKTGDCPANPGGVCNAGDTITYSFQVTNTGTSELTNVLVSDPLLVPPDGPITCPSGNPIPSLAPMASETCTGEYAITDPDVMAGQVDNQATVNGDPIFPAGPPDPPVCPPVEAMDDEIVQIVGSPCIDLSKSCDADLGPDGIAQPGEIIDYDFEVINCGDVTLTNVVINDPMVSIDCSPLTNGAITLLPMTSAFCTGTYVITQADIDAGEKCNIATATGNDPPGNQVGPVTAPEACCQLPSFVIPTLGHLGLLLLALGLAGVGLRRLRRRD